MSASAIVLAAQRAGAVNPLAERAGVSHKCLVPIAGKPLIVRVVETLAAVPGLSRVRISVEPELHAELLALLAPFGLALDCVPSSDNIAESVIGAVDGLDGPILVTTADNVLMSVDSCRATLDALAGADAAMNLATQASVRAVHPDAQRRFYEFRDGGYANCNLYGLAGPHALRAAEAFREGGQFMKNPKRLLTAFGLLNIVLFRFRLVTLQGAARAISRRFGIRIAALVPADGTQAIDVDNERTYGVAEMVLNARQA